MSGTNPVISLEIKDGISDGARAAADSLNKVADAAVLTETRLGKVSATASRLVNSIDPATKSANALAAAQQKLSDAMDTVARSVAVGDHSQAQYDGTITALQQKVRTLSEAHVNGLTPAVLSSSTAFRTLGPQVIQFVSSIQGGINPLTAFAQQGHQVADSLIAQGISVKDLAGVLGGAFRTALGAITSPLGLLITGAAAAGVAVYALGSAAESAQSRLVTLQTQLRSSRDNYTAMADEATRAAKVVAATSNVSIADARAGAQLITANPNFTGDQAQLQRLIVIGADLARVMGKDVPDGAKLLASAMTDAGKVAQDLADQHIAGLSQSLVNQIKNMTAAGQNAQAFGALVDALKGKFDSASKAGTPLEVALHNLDQVFHGAQNGAQSFAEALGKPIEEAAAGAVNAFARIAKGADNLRQILSGSMTLTIDPQGSVKLAPSSGPTPALRTDLANDVQSIAEANKILPEVADFATRIIALGERSPGQFARDGSVLTSPAGALGLMQVMPDVPGGTTRTVGGASYDLTQQSTNIAAGLGILQELYSQFSGDLAKVGVGYNAGPGVASGRVTQGSKAYAETTAYLQRMGLADPRNGSSVTIPPVDVTANRYGVADPNATTLPGVISAAGGTLAAQIQANKDLQKSLQAALATPGLGADDITKYSQALAEARGKATDLITEQQKLARSAQDAVKPLEAQTGAQRELATVTQQFVQAARAKGEIVDPVALETAQSAKLRQLAQDYTDATGAASRQADAQLAINAAYDGSQVSLDHATNAQKALTEAQAKFVPGSAEAVDAAAKYTAQLNRGSDATRALADTQQNLQAGAAAFSSAFNTIGNAITQSFLSGTGAAVNWGNVMKSVMQQVLQQALKLAVLNPILNGLFNQNNPTLGGVISALGQVSSASGGTAAGGGGSSMLGNLQSLYQLGSAGNTLLGSPISFSGISNYLGLGASGGFTGLQNAGFAFQNLMNTQLGISGFGPGISSVYGPVTSGLAAGDAGLAAPGLTVGGALGAAGAIGGGVGVGYLAGSLLQSSMNKTGPSPLIGAGIGAGAGFLLGGPYGALAGGALGGTGGGFIIRKAA